MKGLVFFLALATGAAALYTAEDDVTELTKENFQKTVVESDKIWMVEFYAPWCGHCKNLVPDWKKLASGMKGIAGIGAVDMTAHSEVGEPYDVTGFPTIKMFGADKSKPTDYQGDRSATKMAAAVINEIRATLRKRFGLKAPAAGKPKAEKKAAAGAMVELTEDSFQKEVMESEDLWMVEFYAPWCGHCKNLAPHWKAAAEQLKGKLKMGAVDATKHSGLGAKYKVEGYPTIKYFPKGPKGEPKEYEGGRDTESIVEYGLELLGEKPDDGIEDKVVKLGDDDFDEKVLASQDLWVVEFFAPWCGHCKKLVPEFKKAAVDLDGKAFLATVDCTKHNGLKDKYKIESFPTIKVFSNDKSNPSDFGSRDHKGIVSEIESLLEEHNAAPRPVVQLTDDAALDEGCGAEEGGLCAFLFLPHILDAGAEGRNKDLEMMNRLALKYKKQKVGFFWSEAMAQSKLEAAFDVGNSGYPAMVLVNRKKSRFVPFFSSFSEEGIVTFIGNVFSGVERTMKMPSIPALDTVEAWDGKDGEMPKEEL